MPSSTLSETHSRLATDSLALPLQCLLLWSFLYLKMYNCLLTFCTEWYHLNTQLILCEKWQVSSNRCLLEISLPIWNISIFSLLDLTWLKKQIKTISWLRAKFIAFIREILKKMNTVFFFPYYIFYWNRAPICYRCKTSFYTYLAASSTRRARLFHNIPCTS